MVFSLENKLLMSNRFLMKQGRSHSPSVADGSALGRGSYAKTARNSKMKHDVTWQTWPTDTASSRFFFPPYRKDYSYIALLDQNVAFFPRADVFMNKAVLAEEFIDSINPFQLFFLYFFCFILSFQPILISFSDNTVNIHKHMLAQIQD